VFALRDLRERKAAEARLQAERDAAEARRGEVENSIAGMISAVAAGDFSKRLEIDPEDRSMGDVANGVNRICAIFDEFTAHLAQTLEALLQGDLTRRTATAYGGRFGGLAASANVTVDKLAEMVAEIQAGAADMRTGTVKISKGASDLSGRVDSQAASLEQTSATMDEMFKSIKHNADHAEKACALAGAAARCAEHGGAVVQETVTAMARIEESSAKIADIISVIDGIAFQTNLLALNAAVEAARAGEAGKGFAVVASEVRALAQRAADAAKDIAALIRVTSRHIEEGVSLVRRTGESLEEIVDAVHKVAATTTAIKDSTWDQATGVEEISSAVGYMDEMTQQNAQLAKESAAAARDLSAQAGQLGQLVSFFRTAASGHCEAAGQPSVASPLQRPVTPTGAMPRPDRDTLRAIA